MAKQRESKARSPLTNSLHLDVDEARTREQVDAHLRAVGWIVDTKTLRFSLGARPKRGVNQAIAEWPTASGPADYVLFAGLAPLATVEAKRHIKDIPGHIPQARR